MITHTSVLVAALLSVTFGYEPSQDADEGYDYIVQVEPELLEEMQKGNAGAIEANIPREVNPVRRIRIVVGSDELPRKLRPPQSRTAMRPALDGGTGSTLLAQTGPVGGYGRTPNGFNPGPSGNQPATNPPAATTVPQIDTRYQQYNNYNNAPATNSNAADVSRQRDSEFGVIGEGVQRTRDTIRNTVNNVAQGSQQVLDQGRTTLGDLVSPPDNRTYNPQANPLVNLADSARSEVRNTTEAFTDSWNRLGNVDNRNMANNTAAATSSQPVSTGQFDNWGNSGTQAGQHPATNNQNPAPNGQANQFPQDPRLQDRYAQEQSVLNPSQGQNPGTAPLLDAPRVNDWDANRAPHATTTGATNNAASDFDRGFDDQFGRTTTPRQTVPLPGSNEAFPSGNDWRTNNTANNPPSSNPASSWDHYATTPSLIQQPVAAPTLTGHTAANPATNPPSLTSTGLTPAQTFGDIDLNRGNTTTDASTERAAVRGDAPQTGLYVLAWAIAIGSVGANLFQWGSIVDLRNKYRVALRRNSPGFSRNIAA